MNINSSTTSTTTTSASSSNGFSGFSGIDTESIVEKMMTSYQAKIDKQQQLSTSLTWKQEKYREIIDKINTFKDTYFSAGSSKYIGNVNLYETIKVSSSNTAVGVSGSAAKMGTAKTVQVAQLATASTLTGVKANDGINFDLKNFTVPDEMYDVTLTFGIPKDVDNYQNGKYVDGTGDGYQDDKNGQMVFDTVDITVDGADLKNCKTEIDKVNAINRAIAKAAYGADFQENKVDGGLSTFSDGASTADNNAKLINEGGGGLKISAEYVADGATATNGSSANLALSDKGLSYKGDFGVIVSKNSGKYGLQMLGLTAGQSTVAAYKTATETDKADKILLHGKNGNDLYAEYTFKGSAPVDTSNVGINIGVDLDGVGKYITFTKSEIESFQILASDDAATVQTKTDNFVALFKEKLQSSFGTSIKLTAGTDGKVKLTAGEGQIVTIGGDSDILGIKPYTTTSTSLTSKVGDLTGYSKSPTTEPVLDEDNNPVYEADGVTPKTQPVAKDYTFAINGENITVTSNDTIQNLIDKVNKSKANVKMSYDINTDKFTLTSKVTGENDAITLDDTNGLLSKLGLTDSAAKSTAGSNAIVNINGKVMTRASNSFTVDDVTYTLNNVTGDYDKDLLNPVSGAWEVKTGVDNAANISYKQDATNAVNTMKSFVEDYNKLIEELQKEIDAKDSSKEYPPLTDAQRKEMSEKEIELWETAAKSGLLHGDSELKTFLQNMRMAISTTYDKIGLFHLGIETTKNWKDNGKLEFDEDLFKKQVQNYGSQVYNLFRGKTLNGGFCGEMTKIIDGVANKSSAAPGSLVSLAGVKGYGTESSNKIFTQLRSYSEKIKELQAQYEIRKNSLWAQFTAMEQAMSNMNTQASWLSGFGA